MTIVFVVIGHAGLHDDYRTWMTKGFHAELGAKIYMKKCKDEAERIVLEMQELDNTLLRQWQDTGVPNEYWRAYTKITEGNKVDEYFEYEKPIDYIIEELEIK